MKYIIHIVFLLVLLTGCAANSSRQEQLTHDVPDVTGKVGTDVAAASFDDELEDLDDFDDFGETEEALPSYSDPLEPMNRFFFTFNDKLYYWVLKPVSNAYSYVVPGDVRLSIGNFVNNLAAPIRLLNNLLQWKLEESGVVVLRFVINTTLGVYGFGDPALTEFGFEPQLEDFGQTLGVWGVGEGIYLCWPILGPSNVRDTIGFGVDAYTHPMVYYFDDLAVGAGYYAGSRVNLLSLNPDVYDDLKKYSLDPYVSMRQVYLDYRRGKVDDRHTLQKTDNEL